MKSRVQDAFDKIHAENELKNRTIELIENKTNGYRKRKIISPRRLVAAAACFVLLLSVGIGHFAYTTPAFAISIDVNPSIELGVNCFNKVVTVDTYNEDGNAIMSDIDVYNLDYEEALERILTDKDMEEYITQNELITVTVCGKNEKKNNEILDHVASCTAAYKNVHCSSGNSHETDAAHEAGMSCGKYKVFLELQALDPDITVEDIQGLTMRQIWDMIDELSGNTDGTNQSGGTGGFGGGHHTGHESGHDRGNGYGSSH